MTSSLLLFSTGNRGKSALCDEQLLVEERRFSRREAKAQIEDAGYPAPSDDQIDRWEAAGLLCEPPSARKPSPYGYTSAQAERLVAIARIVSRLGSERTRNAEIAFWLCLEGAVDVPPEFVCEHLLVEARTFQSSTGRILNSLGRRSEGHHLGIIGIAKKLGGLLARQASKIIPSLSRSSLAREVLGTFITLFLYTSAKPNEYSTVARDIRQATTVMRRNSDPPPEPVLRQLFDIIADFSQFLRTDERNPALVAVEQLRQSANPADVFWVIELGAGIITTINAVFPWISEASGLPSLSARDQQVINRHFAPVSCAILATLRNNEHTMALASKLRAGNTDEAIGDLRKLKQVGIEIFDAIAFQGSDDEQ
jgi:hypothetical protein